MNLQQWGINTATIASNINISCTQNHSPPPRLLPPWLLRFFRVGGATREGREGGWWGKISVFQEKVQFFGRFLLVLTKWQGFHFGRRNEDWALGNSILWGLKLFGILYIHQFITSFHFWWKENLFNHQKFSKYNEHDCLENLCLFMSLLTALIVKSIHICAGIYFVFLKKSPRPNLRSFPYQIWTSVKRSRN